MSNPEETLNKLTADLTKMKSAMNRDSTIMSVVSVVVFVALLVYFYMGYSQFKQITEPKILLDAAEAKISDAITTVRQQLENEVEQNADKWAEQLSNKAIETVPGMRNNLEAFFRVPVIGQIEEKIKSSVDLAAPEFEKLISANNEVLKKAFSDMAAGKADGAELVKVIGAEVNARAKTNVQAGAKDALNMMMMLETKLQKLSANSNLNEEEKLERMILTQLRMIQSNQID
ncbi:MAG: hypothetical protein VX438_07810 [Planctomycetota bacterium]|jgi:hypothetical protein|nr:hypothetical protein [Planctomycetota bacterium]